MSCLTLNVFPLGFTTHYLELALYLSITYIADSCTRQYALYNAMLGLQLILKLVMPNLTHEPLLLSL